MVTLKLTQEEINELFNALMNERERQPVEQRGKFTALMRKINKEDDVEEVVEVVKLGTHKVKKKKIWNEDDFKIK